MRSVVLAALLAACAATAQVPQRIVSLSPNVTEMLYGIGAFGKVVGVSDYCTWPAEVKRLPSVGGWQGPTLEKLASLKPDLVIFDNAQAPFVETNMKALGLRTLTVPNHTVDDVYTAILALGRATGHIEQAQKLVASTRDKLRSIAGKMQNRPKPAVALIVNRTPGTLRNLYTATEGSYLAELVAIAGGRIAVPTVPRGYSRLSKEDLLAANPDIILDFIHGSASKLAGNVMEAWKEMPELQAVQAHTVHGVQQDFVPHASQRIVETAQLFARLIHPEVQ